MPTANSTASNVKVRDDDARGAPKGRSGNVAFQPTEEQRQLVRTLAQTFPESGLRYIAIKVGVGVDTLRRHFRDDIDAGRADLLANAGAQLISKALRGDDAKGPDGKLLAPGNLDALKYLLARRGGWTTKVEVPRQAPESQSPLIDLSGLPIEQQVALLPILDQLLLKGPNQAEDDDGAGDDI